MAYSIDVAYAGANVDVALTLGNGTAAVGYKIVPILAAGATLADLKAAYAPLKIRTKKQTTNFPLATTEDQFIHDPGWKQAPSAGQITFIGGLNPCTYRVWVATDCKEVEFPLDPVLEGFGAAGAAAGGTLASISENQTAGVPAVAPTLSTDGISLAGVRALRLGYRAANAGATVNAVGQAKGYWRSSLTSKWYRCSDLDYFPSEAVVEPLGTGPAPMNVPIGADRVQWVAHNMTTSAGNLVRDIEVFK